MMSDQEVAALRQAAIDEAAELVRLAGGPRGFEDSIAACINRAAEKLGWSYRRTEDIWRREARRIESFEMDALRKLRPTSCACNRPELADTTTKDA